jgi:phenylacetate-CoA ligase
MSLEDQLYPFLRGYNALPQWTQSVLGTVYRQLPKAWRLGSKYSEFSELARAAETWSPDQLQEYQLKQLRIVLHHAANHCPYYQKSFMRAAFRPEAVRTLDDMAHCPLLEKQALINHREELVSTIIPANQRLYITTGGSTGVPVGFYLQKGISRPKEQAFLERMWSRAGYFKNARLAVIRGQVTTSAPHGRIGFYDASRNWLLLSSSHLVAERIPEYLEALEKFKPDLIHAYPSAALQLAEYLEKTGQSLRLSLRGLLCGSERLTLPQKRLLQKVFKCRPYRWYGHSERVILAGEGKTSELFYFFPHYGLVEFGEPDEEGMREVIGTSFHNLAMPLIRYRTGDYVRLADPRTDGTLEYPWPAAADIVGREHEFLISGTHRRISLTAFNMHDASFDGLYAVQFYQEEPGIAEFRYLPGPQFDRSRLPKLEAAIRHKLGDDFQVELREVREVERSDRGKHRWLVSRIPAGLNKIGS